MKMSKTIDPSEISFYNQDMGVYKLRNTIKKYPWGSEVFLPALLGMENPSHKPWAELWIGTHPLGESLVETDIGVIGLKDLISSNPVAVLGKDASFKFSKDLPFLLKVLSARSPLSIQAHPDKDQAETGYLRENGAGISLEAPNRNYKDKNWKPELLCALTPFLALCGFRTPREIISFLTRFNSPLTERIIELLSSENPLKNAYNYLLSLGGEEKSKLLEVLIRGSEKPETEEDEWVARLLKEYPKDPLVLSPYIMNLITLKPGQAIFLPPGVPHAYLHGSGVEIMANSDNVLRGGLTAKHIDKSELLSVLKFEPVTPEILVGKPFSKENVNGGAPVLGRNSSKARLDQNNPNLEGTEEVFYPAPVEEFLLSRLRITGRTLFYNQKNLANGINPGTEVSAEVLGSPFPRLKTPAVSIFLCISGELEVTTLDKLGTEVGEEVVAAHPTTPKTRLIIKTGESFLLPADEAGCEITGKGVLFRATIPG